MAPSLINLLSPHNIIIYMLIFTRLTGLFQSAPFFSTIKAPVMTRVWFSATIAFIFYPLIKTSNNFIIPKSMPEFIILILLEFFVGFLIGYIANLILEGARIAGNLLSIQMGLSMSEALDPVTGVNSTEISRLFIYLATLIFISTGAYQMLFMVVYKSFSAVPMGVFVAFNPSIIHGILQMCSEMFKIGFGIALPIFSVLLIVDILLGMMSKMMPQMNVYMAAIPVKIYIGLFLILSFLSLISVYLKGVMSNFMQALSILFT